MVVSVESLAYLYLLSLFLKVAFESVSFKDSGIFHINKSHVSSYDGSKRLMKVDCGHK
jgi:acetone carboxylase gamma subunit